MEVKSKHSLNSHQNNINTDYNKYFFYICNLTVTIVVGMPKALTTIVA